MTRCGLRSYATRSNTSRRRRSSGSRPSSGPRSRGAGRFARADEPPGGQRLRLPAYGQRLDRLGLESFADEPAGGVADQGLAGRGGLLQARGDVDRVAGDERLALGRIACHDLTAVDAGADRDLHAPAALEVAVEAPQLLLQLERRPHRPPGVVLERGRHSEHGHHGVADELLDGPAVALDDRRGGLEVAQHHLPDGLGLEALAQGRRAGDVREQDRHRFSLVGLREPSEARSACIAESRVGWVRLTASPTAAHQPSLWEGFRSRRCFCAPRRRFVAAVGAVARRRRAARAARAAGSGPRRSRPARVLASRLAMAAARNSASASARWAISSISMRACGSSWAALTQPSGAGGSIFSSAAKRSSSYLSMVIS